MLEFVTLVLALALVISLVLQRFSKNPADALDPYRNHGVGLQHEDNDDRG